MMIARRTLLRAGVAAPALLIAKRASAWRQGAAPIYEGLVATRARFPQASSAVIGNQYLSRSAHVATDNITSVRFAFGNFYTSTSLGTSATETYSIEYPIGTYTRLLVAGASPTVISALGMVFTDNISISIPLGATFFVWRYGTNSGGVQYCIAKNTFLGDKCQIGASVSDGTLTGTITDNSPSNAVMPPLAILAQTRKPSVVIVGDSIARGSGDTEDTSASSTGYDGKIGTVARSLGSIPFINLSMDGTVAAAWPPNIAGLSQLVPMGSHLITQLGQNDIHANARTSAQLVADLQLIWAMGRANQKKYQTTLTPCSTGTFSTLVGQTPQEQAVRTTFAAAVKGGLSGLTGYYDVRTVLESSADSDKWIVTPSPPYTPDGIHPNVAGYAAVASSGAISGIVWP